MDKVKRGESFSTYNSIKVKFRSFYWESITIKHVGFRIKLYARTK